MLVSVQQTASMTEWVSGTRIYEKDTRTVQKPIGHYSLAIVRHLAAGFVQVNWPTFHSCLSLHRCCF